ncbi:MAG: cytidine deaminase [Polyangiales bacterium]
MSTARRRGPAVTDATWRLLARAAEKARRRAHAPYSGYHVGAALLTTRGLITGCNVENASYPLCICAEAAAVVGAVSKGWKRWKAIAVATEGPVAGTPCGACRQILAEFGKDLPVGLVVGGKVLRVVTVAELLPFAFDADVLAESTAPARAGAHKTATVKTSGTTKPARKPARAKTPGTEPARDG